tara:strand:+ start:17 stop:430 length:414 start_codon:yes stop_codon:yes gene_type:complete
MKKNRDKWLERYRSNKRATWVNVRLTNGEEHYYDQYEGWRSLKERCDKENIFIQEMSLQFRSHQVDIDLTDAEGIYLIRSLMGQLGGNTRDYLTTGILKGDKVYKKMWIVPELIVDKEMTDSVEDCFEEALIYAKKN